MSRLDHVADLWRVFADALRPPPDLTPEQFAIRHRKMHRVYCEIEGDWDPHKFPYQGPAMNLVQEAVQTGKQGVVYMKGGQVGGTDVGINSMLWLKRYLPGPQLFMTATEQTAETFGQQRFDPILADCEPLAKLRTGSTMLVQKFLDGWIQLAGGQSVFKLQSTPYRVVVIDELDSLVADLGGEGDPVELAKVRTHSFSGQKLMIVYAHPSTRDRGAAKLYYGLSDQRRAFVTHTCDQEFTFDWPQFQVKQGGDPTDAADYLCVCPKCAKEVTEPQRVKMLRAVRFKSALPPEVAQKKTWIGAQFGQLLAPHRTITELVKDRLACGDDENAIKVFMNKVIGEPYEPKLQKLDPDSFRKLIVVKRRPDDPEFYSRGQVPAGVQVLTAGQDSRATQFHFAVWGWGLRRVLDGSTRLCGWLIDWGTIARAYSLVFTEQEYHVFDELLYRRRYLGTDGKSQFEIRQCAHDIGYAPTQAPILDYCRNFSGRAAAAKGASVDASSACLAPIARWGNMILHRVDGAEIKDEGSRALIVNTFLLKSQFYALCSPDRRIEVADPSFGSRKVPQILLPEDVDDDFVKQIASEHLGPGEKKGEQVWKHTGPNHLADCTTYAQALGYNLEPFLREQTATESRRRAPRGTPPAARVDRGRHDPSMG